MKLRRDGFTLIVLDGINKARRECGESYARQDDRAPGAMYGHQINWAQKEYVRNIFGVYRSTMHGDYGLYGKERYYYRNKNSTR